jgi:hypothetical protein
MAIRNPRQLAKRLRQNAVDCEKATSNDLQPEHRALLLKTAEHYRMHADKIDEPGAKWEAFMKSFGAHSLSVAETQSLPEAHGAPVGSRIHSIPRRAVSWSCGTV